MSQDLLAAFDPNYRAGHVKHPNHDDPLQKSSQRFPGSDRVASLLIDVSGPPTEASRRSTTAASRSWNNTTTRNDEPTKASPNSNTLEDDADEWGDFEVVKDITADTVPGALGELETEDSSNKFAQPSKPTSSQSVATESISKYDRPSQRQTHSPYSLEPRLLSFNHTNHAPPQSSYIPVNHELRSMPKPSAYEHAALALKDPNVLFDADDFNENNSKFGDFEGEPRSPGLPTSSLPLPEEVSQAISGLDLGQPANLRLSRSTPIDQASQRVQIIAASGQPKSHPAPQHKNTVVRPKPQAAASLLDNTEEAWDDFDYATRAVDLNQAQQSSRVGAPVRRSKGPEKKQTAVAAAPPAEAAQPPTNVPPPGVLLSLFPGLFKELETALQASSSLHTEASKNWVMSEPATQDSLMAYLSTATVAARVIAGRKLRWKRDKWLAQGMKIGPASSGRAGGMKLTGLDKAETMKEGREVADVVVAWRAHAGRVRSTVATLKSTGTTCLGPVPDIQENLQVKTTRADEGALTAPHQCFLCGLKRDERIIKVDFNVEDSFSEWWVEYWGHRDCKNFWDQQRDRLRQR